MHRFLPFFVFLFLASCNTTTPNSFQQHLNKLVATVTDTSWYRRAQLISPQGQEVHAYFQFQCYDKVVIEGKFNVNVVEGERDDDAIRITGDKAFVSRVQATVLDRTLYIRMNPKYDYKITQPLFIRLPYRQLCSISFDGVGNLVLEHFKSRYFDLTLQGNVNAWIKGNIVLANLNFNNDGKLVMYWVNTTTLNITAGKKGHILLAGVANNLKADVSDSATLDAKYLQTQVAHIRTQKQGKAEINTQQSLNMLAVDQSNIYYYKQPKFIAKYMQGSGSILDMRGVYPPYPQELH
ncbi:MAG: DUF2807 domain-containing protein [Gammaproteobacteria bacterium]|nr:DUF2807 domain-containing protein [Gammaproteobacteria bacterium]